MRKKIKSALVSVYNKDGLEPVIKALHQLGVSIYSTGGTEQFISELNVPVNSIEQLTSYPSILGGRVKTLHPSVFGGILARRDEQSDLEQMKKYNIPEFDLVIVNLYPFEETLNRVSSSDYKGTRAEAEKMVIEKIDVGGPSMIRAAAKNYSDVLVIADKEDYTSLLQFLNQGGETTVDDRRKFAAKAFEIVRNYDEVISSYFNRDKQHEVILRYGENPHQTGIFTGDLARIFTQLHGKELSYNNLVDIDEALRLITEFADNQITFAIIKHTNVCGIASRDQLVDAWKGALDGDPESAFGGVLVCNQVIDKFTAEAIDEIFFEVLIAKGFEKEALSVLEKKKNRILLRLNHNFILPSFMHKSILNGELKQDIDNGNYAKWEEVGGRQTTEAEKDDLDFANIICKHLKSNAIALVKNRQLIGKGCGQTSRIDAVRQAIEKANQFEFDLHESVMASDAFFPFNDCVKMGHQVGITAFIQPGGSIRDKESIDYCRQNNLAMVMTGMRHFRH